MTRYRNNGQNAKLSTKVINNFRFANNHIFSLVLGTIRAADLMVLVIESHTKMKQQQDEFNTILRAILAL